MLKIQILQENMVSALKEGRKFDREVLADLIGAVKRAAIDQGIRGAIPDSITDTVIEKEARIIKEEIETCPENRQDLLQKYMLSYALVSQFVSPKMSEQEIRDTLQTEFAEVMASKNKGTIMRSVVPYFKGKADMAIVNWLVQEYVK